MSTGRPNVVLLVSDQHQGRALGTVDESFSTPALDSLAADGTLFGRCYCTLPQCSPSRSTLVTGQYPHQTGVHTLSNWGPYELDPDAPSVGRAFREAGYETVWSGRWDLGAETLHDLGWRRTRNVDVTGSPGKEGRDRDDLTVAESTDFIRHHANDDQPFFLTAAFNLPHPDFFEDEAFADRYDREAVSLPESFDDDHADKPAFHAERAEGTESRMTVEECREIRYRYRTMVSRVDDYVGRIVDALREAGVYEETIVAFTADHGDMQGAHGLNKKGVIAYEELLHVPLILRVPGREGGTVSDLVSQVGLPATLLDAAGIDAPEGFEGESFLATLSGEPSPTREAVFFEHKYAYWGHHPYRGVRTPDWKFVEYLDGDGAELYHLAEDPHELTNLAGDADYEGVESRLRSAVADWWTEAGGDTEAWVTSPTPD
jgi:choline-sulfatase